MECGRLGMDGLSAQRRAAEDGSKGLVRARIQNQNILEEVAMEIIWKQMIAISRYALFRVSKLLF